MNDQSPDNPKAGEQPTKSVAEADEDEMRALELDVARHFLGDDYSQQQCKLLAEHIEACMFEWFEDNYYELRSTKSTCVETKKPPLNKKRGTLMPTDSERLDKLLDKFPAFDLTWPDELKGKWFNAFDLLIKAGKGIDRNSSDL